MDEADILKLRGGKIYDFYILFPKEQTEFYRHQKLILQVTYLPSH